MRGFCFIQISVLLLFSSSLFGGFMLLHLVRKQLAPNRRVEQNEQREQLQSACEHIKHQHIFGKWAEEIEVCRRAYQRETRTDVVYRCGNGGEVRDQIMTFKRNRKDRRSKDDNKCHDIDVCRANHFVLNRFSVHFDLGDNFRMDIRAHLLDDGFACDDKTRDFDAAAGTACTGTAEHQHDKNCLARFWP